MNAGNSVVWESREPLALPSGDSCGVCVSAAQRQVRIDVVKALRPPQTRLQALYEFCVGVNRDNPTAGLFVGAGSEGRIISTAHFSAIHSDAFESALALNMLNEAISNLRYFDRALTEVFSGADPQRMLSALPGKPAPPSAREDVELLDRAISAVNAAGLPEPRRHGATSAEFAIRSPIGISGGNFLDIVGGQAYCSSYVFTNAEAVTPARRPKVAELLNRISANGVPFALALDFDSGLVRTRVHLSLRGASLDAGPLLLDLLIQTHLGMVLYRPPIKAIASGDVDDPRAALDHHEQVMTHTYSQMRG